MSEQPAKLPEVTYGWIPDPEDPARTFAYALVRPSDFKPGRKYPALNFVYGGPGSNQVNANARAYLSHQWYADQGFVVFTIDVRGTPRRGRAWERVIHKDLITIPLEEQARATLAIAARHTEIDVGRIGISGWSFGGYFSAMGAMRRPDVFKAGIAGAPVCAWEDYDTHYTERFLGLPEVASRNAELKNNAGAGLNIEGYDTGNVVTYAKELSVPLRIIHGTADDNVYFVHSLKMTDALVKSGRNFEFVPLSGFTHAVSAPWAVKSLHVGNAEFFIKALQAKK